MKPHFACSLAALGACLVVATGATSEPKSDNWREELSTFRVGLVEEHPLAQDPNAIARVEKAYSDALGLEARIYVAPDYQRLMQAQADGRVLYGIYSATAYAKASLFCNCVKAFVAPRSVDGASGIRSVLIFRKPAPESMDDIDDFRIGIGPTDNLTANLLPIRNIAPDGLPLSGEESFLTKAGSASELERLFLKKEVDGVFGWTSAGDEELADGTFSRLLEQGTTADESEIIWQSETIPFGPHAMRSDLPEELFDLAQAFLTKLKDDDIELYELLEPLRQGGFSEVSHEDYRPVIDVLER
ncbi:phosphate/phosphite/phosphonate ABC transporter substrate-binding protein [Nitratireductor basaltis]|uniref:Phosphonate ABC transporter, periplasmic phosphonate-binding protein n=1 Tax=Nitratireductor basaltis TaxID=472175 RepID=A0A084UEE3_9HYPH|nr:PhnD/SsuA/transferrin family substrate-binding protein [Nitratireductor basaltis]KFB11329.1 Phosphonate ABC transporter, periplasmic phosphonate-binding protein precursor [Nitratireductor basaltis]